MAETNTSYVLGHSDFEITRLEAQARIVDPISREYFEEGGIESGMRVLDVGSGAGHTAFVVAEIIGSKGSVVGIDTSPTAVASASAEARARALDNVTFRQGDPASMTFEAPFDAIVGRYVLVFQKQPGNWVKSLLHHVRRGGPVVFHEPDLTLYSSSPPVPAYDQCCEWMLEAFGRSNIIKRMRGIFMEAGLPTPTMRMKLMIGGDPEILPWLRVAGDMALSLASKIEQLGHGTVADVERLRREMLDIGDSTIVGRAELGAWALRS